MDTIKSIMTRRSIRKFTEKEVTQEQIDTILKAAFQAPTAHNKQNWEFIVTRDKEVLNSIGEFHPFGKMIPNCSLAITVCIDKEKEDNAGFFVANASAAIQNILLASHALGLGAVWCGLYDVEYLTDNTSKILNLPENIIPIGIVPIGNKTEDKKIKDSFDKEKIHYNKW
jgi:nitroreductase